MFYLCGSSLRRDEVQFFIAGWVLWFYSLLFVDFGFVSLSLWCCSILLILKCLKCSNIQNLKSFFISSRSCLSLLLEINKDISLVFHHNQTQSQRFTFQVIKSSLSPSAVSFYCMRKVCWRLGWSQSQNAWKINTF